MSERRNVYRTPRQSSRQRPLNMSKKLTKRTPDTRLMKFTLAVLCLVIVSTIGIGIYVKLRDGKAADVYGENTGLTVEPSKTDDPPGEHKSTSPKPSEPSLGITFTGAPDNDTTVYDCVILNVRLINPETNNDITGMNIGIKDGSIATITSRPITGNETIDASGLVASPGFIDIDSYEPNPLGVKYKLADGVTTNLLMHGGSTYTKNWYNTYKKYPPLINYGASNFITKIRAEIGYGIGTVMTNENDIARSVKMVEQNIKDGALGVSMSPEYCPGLEGAEMQAYCELAAKYGLATYYHLRYSTTEEPNTSIKAIQEVIDLSKLTGVSTHILHVTSTGSTHCAPEAFAVIEQARNDGIDLSCDIYPYDSWATYLGSNRFSEGWQHRFGLGYSDLQLPNTTIRLTENSFGMYKSANRLVIALGSIPEEEVRLALKKPYVFIATDTIIEPSMDDHPRGSGSYARLIGKYARDEHVITLTEAIAKATLLPAQRLEGASPDMKKKGRLEIGADADIVLFDYNTIIDKSTPENVAVYSDGISYVFVNGSLIYDHGTINNIQAAKPVRNYLVSPEVLPETEQCSVIMNGKEIAVTAYFPYGDGVRYAALSDIAEATGIEYETSENGEIFFGHARLSIGKTEFESYGQSSNLSHEPVIYRGKIYAALSDFNSFEYGLTVQRAQAFR